MTLENLIDYVKQDDGELVKIEPTLEMEEDGTEFRVVKTKETYHFYDELSADEKINEARNDHGFAGCDKKFKAGKVNKAGEVTRPDIWQVVIKLNH